MHYDTTNAYGSAGTKIRKYTNLTASQNAGTLFTANNSATNGLSITINVAGWYSFSYTEVFNTGEAAGLTVDAPDLTQDVTDVPVANILCTSFTGANAETINLSWSGYLAVGAIVRPHTRGTTDSAVQVRGQFWAQAI